MGVWGGQHLGRDSSRRWEGLSFPHQVSGPQHPRVNGTVTVPPHGLVSLPVVLVPGIRL